MNTKTDPVDLVALGARLESARKAKKLSLAQAEKSTKIRVSILEKIESGQYQLDVYWSGLVNNYAKFLNLDPEIDNSQGASSIETSKIFSVRPINDRRLIFTPKTFLFLVLSFIFGTISVFIAIQLRALLSSPKIELDNIDQVITINQRIFELSGKTDNDSDVFINDSPVLSNQDGSFSEVITLSQGYNNLVVSARNRLGKQTDKELTIIVDAPEVTQDPLEEPEITPEDTKTGKVILKLKVGQSATWLVVTVDGNEVFRGTLLAGVEQEFVAQEQIGITTGNAKSTQLSLTNDKVTDYQIGELGAEGEVKRDLIFGRDTEFIE